MKTSWLRQLLSLVLMLSFSGAGWGAEDTHTRAVLQASGKVQVNGNASRQVTTLFAGDIVETDGDSAANIIAGGSSVLVLPGTSVKFLGTGMELTEGGMTITTSGAMTATVDDLMIAPAGQNVSKFEITEDEDTVLIAARQGNVAVSDGQQTSTVPEGQETKRKKKKKGGGAVPGGSGGAISGKTLAIIGGAAGGTVAGILIAEKGKQKCLSASGNKKCVCHKKTTNVDVCEIED